MLHHDIRVNDITHLKYNLHHMYDTCANIRKQILEERVLLWKDCNRPSEEFVLMFQSEKGGIAEHDGCYYRAMFIEGRVAKIDSLQKRLKMIELEIERQSKTLTSLVAL